MKHHGVTEATEEQRVVSSCGFGPKPVGLPNQQQSSPVPPCLRGELLSELHPNESGVS